VGDNQQSNATEDKVMSKKDIEAIVAEYAGEYPPLIMVEDAGQIAHVPPATIHSWSSAGRLDAFKVRRGRRVLFQRDAFVRFMLEGRGHMEVGN
jgi:hypothetical protein